MYIRARPLLSFSSACIEKNVRVGGWVHARRAVEDEIDKAMVGISGRASGQAGGS